MDFPKLPLAEGIDPTQVPWCVATNLDGKLVVSDGQAWVPIDTTRWKNGAW